MRRSPGGPHSPPDSRRSLGGPPSADPAHPNHTAPVSDGVNRGGTTRNPSEVVPCQNTPVRRLRTRSLRSRPLPLSLHHRRLGVGSTVSGASAICLGGTRCGVAALPLGGGRAAGVCGVFRGVPRLGGGRAGDRMRDGRRYATSVGCAPVDTRKRSMSTVRPGRKRRGGRLGAPRGGARVPTRMSRRVVRADAGNGARCRRPSARREARHTPVPTVECTALGVELSRLLLNEGENHVE